MRRLQIFFNEFPGLDFADPGAFNETLAAAVKKRPGLNQ